MKSEIRNAKAEANPKPEIRMAAAEPQRGSITKPRVAATRLPWVGRRETTQPRRGCADCATGLEVRPMECDSIPDITFIKFKVVFSQQGTQFVLKAHLGMVRFLVTDVLDDLVEFRLAHRKICIAALPFEVSVFGSALFQPEIGDAFEFLDPVGLGGGASEAGK